MEFSPWICNSMTGRRSSLGSTAGIGLAIAGAGRRGAKVIIAGRTQANSTKRSRAFVLLAVPASTASLADPAKTEGAATLLEATPSVDILVNNLGIMRSRNFIDITDEMAKVLRGQRAQWSPAGACIISGDVAEELGPDHLHLKRIRLLTPGPMISLRDDHKTAQLAISRGLAEMTKGTECDRPIGATRTDPLGGHRRFLKSLASDPEAPTDQIEAEFFRQGAVLCFSGCSRARRDRQSGPYVASPLSSATMAPPLRVDGGVIATIG